MPINYLEFWLRDDLRATKPVVATGCKTNSTRSKKTPEFRYEPVHRATRSPPRCFQPRQMCRFASKREAKRCHQVPWQRPRHKPKALDRGSESKQQPQQSRNGGGDQGEHSQEQQHGKFECNFVDSGAHRWFIAYHRNVGKRGIPFTARSPACSRPLVPVPLCKRSLRLASVRNTAFPGHDRSIAPGDCGYP